MRNKILKIGHRGAKGYVVENTIASIEKALSLNVDGIEIDVHKCKSGELVVFHDFTLDRITNGTGEISNFTLKELKQLKVEKFHGIPTLEEVINYIDRKCILNIELKGKNTAIKTVETIENYIEKYNWKYEDFIVSSFQFDLLSQAFEANKNIQIGVLTDINLNEALQFAKAVKAVAIHPDYTMLTKENVNKLQKENIKIYTWTVNEQDTIKRIKSYNVNGIISDFPDRI